MVGSIDARHFSRHARWRSARIISAHVAVRVDVMKPGCMYRAVLRLASHDQHRNACAAAVDTHAVKPSIPRDQHRRPFAASDRIRHAQRYGVQCLKGVRYLEIKTCFTFCDESLAVKPQLLSTARLLSESPDRTVLELTACVVSVMTRRGFKREPSQACILLRVVHAGLRP
jgi:hypothetical protein